MLTADEKVKELNEILEAKNLEMDEMRVQLDHSPDLSNEDHWRLLNDGLVAAETAE